MTMTRKEALERYRVKDGRIQDPGKFQGEMIYVPVYWEAGLEGLADEDTGTLYIFNLGLEDKIEFPELIGKRKLRLRESDVGFIYEVDK